MGLFSAIGNVVKGELIDVIQWTDNTQNTMVYKYDMNGKEIMNGAQLTVRESQAAVFVSEGQLADVFGPGRYELTTSNLPVLTKIKSWKYGFNSPFKSDVYFVNTKQFMDCKWGTSNPVMMRDSDFGMIRIRAFGTYSFKVKDPATFMRECFGTNALFKVDGVEGQIKSKVVSGLSDAIAQSKIPALDMAANYDELGAYCLNALNPRIEEMGLTLCAFVVENISLPEEVEKAMDTRTSMGVVGDMGQYTQFQAAAAMRDAANNQNGMAGLGAGMGAAAMMGQMFSGLGNQTAAAAAAPAAAPAAATVTCSACGKQIAQGSKFCPECGAQQVTAAAASAFCPNCGNKNEAGVKFCPNCGQKLG